MSNSSTSNAPWRILCIDDEPDVLEILRITLSTKHEVVVARDGIEAMGMLDLSDPDFVICDVRMPKMDGFQTVEGIRKHPRFFDIPVFFLTAEHGSDMAKQGFASGANLYLTKPFDPMRILQNIDFFLEEHGLQPRSKRFTPQEVEQEVLRLSSPEPPPQSAPEAVRSEPVDPGRARVIIICSDRKQLDRYHKALRHHHECIACADAHSSLPQLFRYDPDILIMNPIIPKLSGFGIVQMIRGNKKLHSLPILLIDDENKGMDPRLIPTITKYPVLRPHSTSSEITHAVENVIASPKFFIHPKRATIKELVAEEEKLRKVQEAEEVRRLRQKANIQSRYGRIQEFINSNV